MSAAAAGSRWLGGVWILCLLLQITTQSWASEASGIQYGHLGSSVTLSCAGSRRGSPVEWRLNGSPVLPPQAVSQNWLLMLPSVDLSMEGNYSCHDHTGHPLHAVQLRLGYLPGEVNITCRRPIHSKVFCSWTQQTESLLPTHYITTYIVESVSSVEEETCEQDGPQSRRCVIRIRPWLPKQWINVTEVNPLGSQQSVIRIYPADLMKPDPPEDVVCEQVEGHPTRLLVEWKSPSSWLLDNSAVFPYPLTYCLRYKPMGSNYWSTMYTEENTSLTIMDALAGHAHHIQVAAHDGLSHDGQWSEWSDVAEREPWADVSASTDVYPEVPDYEPELNSTLADTSTVKGSESDGGSFGVALLLAIFGGMTVVVGVPITLLLWMRQRRRGGLSKQQLNSIVNMKPLLT